MGRETPATLTAPVPARPDVVVRRHAKKYRAPYGSSPRVAARLARFDRLAFQRRERVKADQAVVLTKKPTFVARLTRGPGAG